MYINCSTLYPTSCDGISFKCNTGSCDTLQLNGLSDVSSFVKSDVICEGTCNDRQYKIAHNLASNYSHKTVACDNGINFCYFLCLNKTRCERLSALLFVFVFAFFCLFLLRFFIEF